MMGRSNSITQAIETRPQARREDIRRELMASAALKVLPVYKVSKADAKRVLTRLRKAANGSLIRTLASKQYFRRERRHRSIGLLKLYDREQLGGLRPITLIPKTWSVAAADLMSIDPGRLLQALRADLYRCGAAKADGTLHFCLDVEFEPTRQLFSFHAHGFATRGMVCAIDSLRKRPKYKPQRGTMTKAPIRTPVRIQRDLPREEWPSVITYSMKSAWFSRWVSPPGADGRCHRAKRRQRIPEPFGSLLLAWFDQWQFDDLVLMIGIEKAGSSLRLSCRPGPSAGRRA